MSEVPILAASPDGRYKITYGWYESGGRLRPNSEKVCLFEDGRDPRLLQPLLNWAVICAALSKDGVLALGLEPFPELYPYVDRLDETIAVLDIHGDGEFTFIEREIEQRHAPSVRALAFSNDGTLLVAGGKHGVTVWDTASRTIVRAIAPVHDRFNHVGVLAVSPDNGTIAFATQAGAVLLCPTFGDRKPFALVADGGAVDAMAFSDSLTVAITFAGGSLRRWDARSGRELSAGVRR
jgi:WD40 repeat protein